MARDWARLRRELALPNSAHRQAGGCSILLSKMHWAESKGWSVKAIEYEICHIVLISALFNLVRRGTYVDSKRRCVWAVDVDLAQLPSRSSLPPGIDHVRCIITHGPKWTFSQPGTKTTAVTSTREVDMRTPRGRLEILDVVAGVGARDIRARGGRGRGRERHALRERTLLQNARNVGRRAMLAEAKGGGAEGDGGDDGRGEGGGAGLVDGGETGAG